MSQLPYNTSFVLRAGLAAALVRTEELPALGGAAGGLCGSDDQTSPLRRRKINLMPERRENAAWSVDAMECWWDRKRFSWQDAGPLRQDKRRYGSSSTGVELEQEKDTRRLSRAVEDTSLAACGTLSAGTKGERVQGTTHNTLRGSHAVAGHGIP